MLKAENKEEKNVPIWNRNNIFLFLVSYNFVSITFSISDGKRFLEYF